MSSYYASSNMTTDRTAVVPTTTVTVFKLIPVKNNDIFQCSLRKSSMVRTVKNPPANTKLSLHENAVSSGLATTTQLNPRRKLRRLAGSSETWRDWDCRIG
ncbi:UNVERIFIED_CONTAM: hypothetical protein HHA_451740 [Hammondia hammondi]|eukprot:XP_008884679.1 hypothetical protein HHA_451740 [Hammondia hammondi]